MNNKYLLIIFLTAFGHICKSQTNPLNKEISVNISNQKLENALHTIGSIGNVYFSYNSDLLPVDSIVSIDCKKVAIYKILNQILESEYDYKTTGEHIIIQKKKTTKNKSYQANEKKTSITGTVIDAETGIQLTNTSVFNISGKEGVLTDKNGNFSLSIYPEQNLFSLSVNKQKYKDTIVFVKYKETTPIVIRLSPKLSLVEPIQSKALPDLAKFCVEQSPLVVKFVKQDMIIHANNINYYTQRPLQISFLPFLGSNYKLSGTIVNKFSVNVLSGYAYGVSGVEIGGMFNIIRNDVEGVQIAGFANITGKNTNGIQIAGFVNHNFGKLQGVQIAGFSNVMIDSMNGTQISGFSNYSKKNCKGIQISGFSNITTGNHRGVQVSGFSNIVKGSMNGTQISGFSNVSTQNVKGVQLSGFINYAKKVNGVQIGIINLADTVNGASFGLINIVKKGVNELSLNTDEMGSVNLNINYGANRFYNVMGITAQPFSDSLYLGVIYGFGSQLITKKKFILNLKILGVNLVQAKSKNLIQNQLYKIATNADFRITNRISIFVGPSFTLIFPDKNKIDTNYYPKNLLFKESEQDFEKKTNYKTWFGATLGVKYNINYR